MVATQAATDACEKRMALVAFDSEVAAGKCLDHFALNLDQIISCHGTPSVELGYDCDLLDALRKNVV